MSPVSSLAKTLIDIIHLGHEPLLAQHEKEGTEYSTTVIRAHPHQASDQGGTSLATETRLGHDEYVAWCLLDPTEAARERRKRWSIGGDNEVVHTWAVHFVVDTGGVQR